MHVSPLFWIPFPFRSPQSVRKSYLCLTVQQQVSLSICFMHSISSYTCMCIYVSPDLPVHPLTFAPLMSIRLLSVSVSLFLLCKYVHQYTSRFLIYAVIYNIVFFFLIYSLCMSLVLLNGICMYMCMFIYIYTCTYLSQNISPLIVVN